MSPIPTMAGKVRGVTLFAVSWMENVAMYYTAPMTAVAPPVMRSVR